MLCGSGRPLGHERATGLIIRSALLPDREEFDLVTRRAGHERAKTPTRETTSMNSNLSALGSKSAGASADAASEDRERDALSSLQRDVASLRDTLARLASRAGDEATKTARNMSETLA